MSRSEPPGTPGPPEDPPTHRLGEPVARQPRPPAQPAYGYDRLPPEPPPPGPWWENPWTAFLTGLVALVIGGFIGYAIGNSGEGERTTGAATQTVTNTTTVVRPKTVVHTNTVTASTVTERPSPANQTNEERRAEAEANLRKAEQENRELRRQVEEAGRAP